MEGYRRFLLIWRRAHSESSSRCSLRYCSSARARAWPTSPPCRTMMAHGVKTVHLPYAWNSLRLLGVVAFARDYTTHMPGRMPLCVAVEHCHFVARRNKRGRRRRRRVSFRFVRRYPASSSSYLCRTTTPVPWPSLARSRRNRSLAGEGFTSGWAALESQYERTNAREGAKRELYGKYAGPVLSGPRVVKLPGARQRAEPLA